MPAWSCFFPRYLPAQALHSVLWVASFLFLSLSGAQPKRAERHLRTSTTYGLAAEAGWGAAPMCTHPSWTPSPHPCCSTLRLLRHSASSHGLAAASFRDKTKDPPISSLTASGPLSSPLASPLASSASHSSWVSAPWPRQFPTQLPRAAPLRLLPRVQRSCGVRATFAEDGDAQKQVLSEPCSAPLRHSFQATVTNCTWPWGLLPLNSILCPTTVPTVSMKATPSQHLSAAKAHRRIPTGLRLRTCTADLQHQHRILSSILPRTLWSCAWVLARGVRSGLCRGPPQGCTSIKATPKSAYCGTFEGPRAVREAQVPQPWWQPT